jgi:citrate synthase
MARTVTHQVENDETSPAMFGDEEHFKVVQQRTFSELIFELLSHQRPTPGQLKLFNMIFNLSIDHGPNTPSAAETIKAAKEGKTISESLAAGVLQINDRHGGAIEPGMRELYRIKEGEVTPEELVNEYEKDGKFLPGFWHRIYKNKDPRANLIFREMHTQKFESGLFFLEILEDLESLLKDKKGKTLPINIDGAIAAVLCGFGWDPKLGKAVFLIARTPGLIGQYLNNS